MPSRILSEDASERKEGFEKLVKIFELALGVCGILMVGLLTATLLVVLNKQDVINQCTVPGHACFIREQKATNQFRDELKVIIEASNWCSSRKPNIEFVDLESCVDNVLTAKGH